MHSEPAGEDALLWRAWRAAQDVRFLRTDSGEAPLRRIASNPCGVLLSAAKIASTGI